MTTESDEQKLESFSVPRHSIVARATPYVVATTLFFTQGALVIMIEHLCKDFHHPDYGPWTAWLLFVVGGYAIGLLHLHIVKEHEPLRDPLHATCAWLLRRLHVVGFVIATLMLGSMGASIALKHEGYLRRPLYSFVAALLYASAWIPLYISFSALL